jgi:hypothetical protein
MRAPLFLALLLTACGPKAPIAVEVRTVEVPVPVACVKPDQIPAEPPSIRAQLTGNPVVDVMVLAESALALRKWGQEQNALLTGCV